MLEFDDSLAELARHAETTGRLAPAAAVRARADRRRRHRNWAVAGLGVVVAVALTAGIAIAQPLGGRPRPPAMEPAPWVSSLPATPTSPVVTAPPAPTAPVVTPPPASEAPPSPPAGLTQAQTGLDHRRAYRLVPVVAGVAGPGGLGVGKDGRVDVLEPGAVFTTATTGPGDDEWLIRLDERGGSRCLTVRPDSTFGTGKCLPSNAAMRLRYHPAGTDGAGHPAYVIGFDLMILGVIGREHFLSRDPADGGRVALMNVPRARATAWSFVDQGPSTLAR